ncbi:MAG: hypothetical protein PHP69_07300 [Candidatus Omnitrophica bacterium]|nr:hypothetical protein [Candidatus Omnitrophota bacterium]MDD5081152.1 hypothetical protein [Candidatus Omnitrophota bacterium]MDD5441693.1 hypothetical protein [Candidatus Omnitrophota bacterium]
MKIIKYQKPSITKIALDPEQAILQVCSTGGGYFIGTTKCVYNFSTGPFHFCAQTVRGDRDNAAGFLSSQINSKSS